jgi:hypothetical protein
LALKEKDAFQVKRSVVIVSASISATEWTEREEQEEEEDEDDAKLREHSPGKREHCAPFLAVGPLEHRKMETVVVLIVEKRHWIPDFGPITYGHVETLVDDC